MLDFTGGEFLKFLRFQVCVFANVAWTSICGTSCLVTICWACARLPISAHRASGLGLAGQLCSRPAQPLTSPIAVAPTATEATEKDQLFLWASGARVSDKNSKKWTVRWTRRSLVPNVQTEETFLPFPCGELVRKRRGEHEPRAHGLPGRRVVRRQERNRSEAERTGPRRPDPVAQSHVSVSPRSGPRRGESQKSDAGEGGLKSSRIKGWIGPLNFFSASRGGRSGEAGTQEPERVHTEATAMRTRPPSGKRTLRFAS